MKTYGPLFARFYNQNSYHFACQIAPRIREYYETTCPQLDKSLLDIGCGTGQLGVYFLRQGYYVLGIDKSEHMLNHARLNAATYIASDCAEFLQADATDFKSDQRFGLAVSTYDALNHLPNEEDLQRCLASTASNLLENGIFIFDLNTRHGLQQSWNNIAVLDSPEQTIINRKIYDGSGRGYAKLTGFLRSNDGTYERFEEHIFNQTFDLARVKSALLEESFRRVHFATIEDLAAPVEDPEELLRVVIVAQK